MRAKASRRYPLPAEERSLLVKAVLLSDALMLVMGIALAVVRTAFEHGSWSYALAGFGWLDDLAASLAPHPAMIAAPIALVALLSALDRLLWPRSQSYREQVIRIRRGVNGELVRLHPLLLLALFAFVGLSEELLFRYGLVGFLAFVFGQAFSWPWALAAAGAAVLSAAVFALAHVQYESTFGNVAVFAIGLLFAVLYLATGSLLVVAVAHWLYDFGDVVVERFRMEHDPDYFRGAPPTGAVFH